MRQKHPATAHETQAQSIYRILRRVPGSLVLVESTPCVTHHGVARKAPHRKHPVYHPAANLHTHTKYDASGRQPMKQRCRRGSKRIDDFFFANSSVVDQGYAKGMPFELLFHQEKKKSWNFSGAKNRPRQNVRCARSPHPLLLRQYDARVIPSRPARHQKHLALARADFAAQIFLWVCGRQSMPGDSREV